MMHDMDEGSERPQTSTAHGRTWIAVIAVAVLIALVLVILTRMPLGNLFQQSPNATPATVRITPTAATPSLPATVSVAEVLARARATHFKDMSGVETILYGDGGSTKATIQLTANPLRSHETDAQYDAEGHLTEIQDEVRDGSRRYQRIQIYRTNPPTDSGWKLDPHPVPDPRPLPVFLLDAFTDAGVLIGIEVLNGVSAYHLQVQLSSTSRQEVWIRTDNYYLAQWQETDSFSRALITMTAWDTGIDIAVPAV